METVLAVLNPGWSNDRGWPRFECPVMDPIILGHNSPDQSEGEGQCIICIPGPLVEIMWKNNEGQSQITQEEDSKRPWPQCSMYLLPIPVYCIKRFWDLEKCIKIKAVQQGKIEWGAFVLSLSTKQWLQMWKRPEMLGFLSNLTGCSLQPTSWVCLACCWHLCNRTSL